MITYENRLLFAFRRLDSDARPPGASGRNVGRTRVFRINPRYFAYEDLNRYLWRLTEPDDDLRERVARLRRRPRRTGKAL